MNKLPVILVTPCTELKGAEFSDRSLSLSQPYTLALQAAGALPWIVPVTLSTQELAECVRRADGVMLTGGDDLQSELYANGLPAALAAKIGAPDPPRDFFELNLIEQVFTWQKPLLAICRGHQLLNVAFGGSLIVDIPTQLPQALDHRRLDRKCDPVHSVALHPDSVLARIFGTLEIRVNSTHHQSVDRLAKPFQITAASEDSIPEAMELRPAESGLLPFLLSVQFHPERLFVKFPEFLGLFREFTQACVRTQKSRV